MAVERDQHPGSSSRVDVPQTSHLPHHPDMDFQGVANRRLARKWREAAGSRKMVCLFNFTGAVDICRKNVVSLLGY